MPAHDTDRTEPDRTEPVDPADPLSRERAHLSASRSALRAMREDVENLDIKDVTANWVNAVVLTAQIEDRIKALADLSHTPLFFGRLDYLHTVGAAEAEGSAGERPLPEAAEMRVYIGRRHVHDADGDPMVIDWRAPVSQPFYRASKKDPQDVGLRRRFGYTAGELTAYEDEHLSDTDTASDTDATSDTGAAHTSKLLQAEIERPRVGPMRDIVATIQPEQDEIVRAGLSGSVCVQGGPGTGKTAVGLHRVAYLLYAHRDRLARTGTLVIGPNKSFLHYIEQVLPALGELEVKQATVDDLVTSGDGAGIEIRGTDEAAAAVIKGDARMAEVLRRAVRSHVTPPTESLMVVRGSRRWRVPAYELEEIVGELQARDIRYGAAREALPQRIAHQILVRMEEAGEAPDDRVQDAVARNAAVKAVVKAIWPPVDPAKLVLRLLADAEFLAEHADGVLTPAEQSTILWAKPARSPKSAKWSAADAVLIDEARDLVARTHSLGHVVLDEAQDLSPMQYRAVGRRCSTGSATILGDLAQGTTPWATASWAEALTHLGKPDALVEELTAGFRVPRDVIAYASRLLPHMSPGLAPVSSVRESPGDMSVQQVADEADLNDSIVAACEAALTHEGSIGLIAADARIPDLAKALEAAGHAFLSPGEETTAASRLTLVPASLAKGLEYDYVVLDEPTAIVTGEPDERTGLRRLYVALTRAVSGLAVRHSAPLPPALTT
ncbi:HelD family protein [Streptomyces sp. NPDC021093]|uniref:HelD family protein n=1 Tax=Streptomyces sp. NPDC021093 TaxID=3365112 RepID=UPI00378CD2A7